MPFVKRIQQISESHCGPAVISMLLGAIGFPVTQEEVARVAGVEDTIEEQGTRPDQLAIAVTRLAPQAQFWYKYHSTLDDIRFLLQNGYAVGVEWQGLFYESEQEEEEEEEEDADHGHYSIISHIDEDRQALIIVDPYKEFSHQDRIFSIPMFLRRWWDTNEMIDPFTGKTRLMEDIRFLFFITPADVQMPPERGFQRVNPR